MRRNRNMIRNKKSSDWQLLRDALAKSVRSSRPLAAGLIAVITGASAASVVPPLVLERVVNMLSEKRVIPIALAAGYFLTIVLSDVLESLQNALITVFGQKMTHGIRSILCAKLSRLPAEYYHVHESGETASIFTNDGDAIDVIYSDGVVSMIADSFRLIAILIAVFSRSFGLGILIGAILPLLYVFTRWCQRRMKQAQLDNRRAIARVNGHIPETLRCMRVIRTYRAQRYMEETYDKYIQESYRATNRSNFIDSIYSPVILLTQAAVVAVMMVLAAYGGGFRAAFNLSVGSAVAMIAYVGQIFSPLGNIGMEIQNKQAAAAAFTHIEEFLEEKEWQPHDAAAACTGNENEIAFDRVTFCYSENQPVLRDLSFSIKAGENVTFVGRTGAGKSTIFRLLTGLYEPDAGRVRLGSKDPYMLKPEERRRIYGYVEQDFAAVPGTVRDQITLFDPEITEAAIEHALALTSLSGTIRALPHGLDTPMDEKLFSKGQLQLLSIARAVAADPEILLLDEVTASLDAATEKQILRAIRDSAKGRTVLSISHRLSESIGTSRIIEIGRER